MNKDILDIEFLEAYLEGKLSPAEMYFVEREALSDPFIFEALEGLNDSPKRQEMLSLLQLQMRARVQNAPIARKRWTIQTHRLSIAATAAILFVSASIIFWMKNSSLQNNNTSKNVEVALTDLELAKSGDVVASSTLTEAEDKAVIDSNSDKTNASAHLNTGDLPVVASVAARKVTESSKLPAQNADEISPKMNVMSRSSNAIASSAVIVGVYAGKIVDGDTGLPIKGIEIIRKSDGFKFEANSNGEFRVQPLNNLLTDVFKISAPGYISQEINLHQLEEAKISLKKEI